MSKIEPGLLYTNEDEWIKVTDSAELNDLMDVDAYAKYLEEQS